MRKDYNKTEMRTLIKLLYGSIAMKEQALSSKISLWNDASPKQLTNLKKKPESYSDICCELG